jgi:hypothetical protein
MQTYSLQTYSELKQFKLGLSPETWNAVLGRIEGGAKSSLDEL